MCTLCLQNGVHLDASVNPNNRRADGRCCADGCPAMLLAQECPRRQGTVCRQLVEEAAEVVEAGVGGYHVLNVTGKGTQQGVEVFTGRGASTTTRAALPKTVITTVVRDGAKDAVVEAIISASRTGSDGQIGDGKIFVSPVSEVIRVRTGEKDEAAL